MSIEVKHWTVTLDFDVWYPHKSTSIKELDELIGKLKRKELLHSCGNVKATIREE